MHALRTSGTQMARWRRAVGYGLRHHDDWVLLDGCELAGLRIVQRVALTDPYRDRFKRNGRVVRDLLKRGVELAREEFSGPPLEALEWILVGDSVTRLALARDDDRSRLHRRDWRPVLDFFVAYLWELEGGARDAA
jgi:hypothetical protein